MRSVLASLLLTACTCGSPPAPTEAVPAPVEERPADDPRIAQMEHRALPDEHDLARMRYDEDLARTDDPHLLARRAYEQLIVANEGAPARGRSDLERALTLAGSDVRLAAAIEHNLGVLDERTGHADSAAQHYARAQTLDASRDQALPSIGCMRPRPCLPP